MFRDMLSGSRAIFIGVVFFVLVVGGSLLYSWHVHRTTDAEVAETQRKVQPLDKAARTAQDTVDTSAADFEHAGTDLETDDAQAMSDDTGAAPSDDAAPIDLSEAFLPDDFVSEEAPAEDVPVSPYGLGPYPEVPIGFPVSVEWSSEDKEGELHLRVMIKAWNAGERFVGASTGNGKLYLHYPNTVYVQYGERLDANGNVIKYVRRAKGAGDVPVPPPGENFSSDVRVLDFDSAGIDPYEYLNLQP